MYDTTPESLPFFNESLLKMKEVSVAAPYQKELFALGNDSLTTQCFMPQKMVKARFVTALEPPKIMREKTIQSKTSSSDLLIGMVPFAIFAIIVFTKAMYPRRFFQMIKASFSNSAQWLLLHEWYPLNNGLSYLYSGLYFLSYTLLLRSIGGHFGSAPAITGHEWIDLLIIFGAVGVVIIGKYLTILMLALIFDVKDSGERYLTTQITFSLLTVLLLVPLLLILEFQDNDFVFFMSLTLLGLLHLIRISRSFAVGLAERSFNLFYLFLYLCTLEIVPLLVLLKTVLILSNGEAFG